MTTSHKNIQNRTALINDLLKGLLKTVKVIAAYPENNPIPVSARESYVDKLVDAIRQYGSIELQVERDRLLVQGEEVYVDRGKEECLAGLLHRNGLSQLTLGESLYSAEVNSLLDVFGEYIHTANLGADLVSLIWEANLPSVTYETVENVDLLEFDETFDIKAYLSSNPDELPKYQRYTDDETREYSSLFESDDKVERAGLDEDGRLVEGDAGYRGADAYEAADSPDAALILNSEFELSNREEDDINEMLDADAHFDMYESTAALVQELMAQDEDLVDFRESLLTAEKVHNQCVANGRLDCAAQLMTHIAHEQQRLGQSKPLWADALARTTASLSGRDSMRLLAECLNQRPEFSVSELRPYLDRFTWEALAGLTGLLGELEIMEHRLCLRDFLAERGRDRIDIVATGIFDKRWYVVRNTVTILARIDSERTLHFLSKAVDHEDRRVRLELVDSLAQSGLERYLPLLKTCLFDPDLEVRHGSMEAILKYGSEAAYQTISQAVNDHAFAQLEPAEQLNLVRAYSRLGGEQALPLLRELAEKWNFLARPRLRFMRSCALSGIEVSPATEADDMLLRMARSWRLDLRRQANQALKSRRPGQGMQS
ncbi:MAG: HEAT repeat domain-containing protein [bacterium]